MIFKGLGFFFDKQEDTIADTLEIHKEVVFDFDDRFLDDRLFCSQVSNDIHHFQGSKIYSFSQKYEKEVQLRWFSL